LFRIGCNPVSFWDCPKKPDLSSIVNQTGLHTRGK
jgi:hypothetical protein